MFKHIKAARVSFPDAYWHNVSDEAKELLKKLLQRSPQNRISAKEVLNGSPSC